MIELVLKCPELSSREMAVPLVKAAALTENFEWR